MEAICFEAENGTVYKITGLTDSPKVIDALLDQMWIMKHKDISEEEFQSRIFDPMTLDLMDESGRVKIGEMICENCYTGEKG